MISDIIGKQVTLKMFITYIKTYIIKQKSLKKGSHFQNLTYYSVPPSPLNGQNAKLA